MNKQLLTLLLCIMFISTGCGTTKTDIQTPAKKTDTPPQQPTKEEICQEEGISSYKESPDEKYLLFYCNTPEDSQTAQVYEKASGNIHQLTQKISNIVKSGWQPNGEIFFYEGCILADYCKRYQSQNSNTPWEVEFTNDGIREGEKLSNE
ncbi:MAG: hypothetical protein GW939_01390 [Candidatus Magasanikbacteria bacterium]|nr:hypothetical protein [Candidatus Magasanikbacteria bacterium]NCS72211.1 hypothetical protein [Candidatus Magasanikbacteria bacterium]